MASAQNWIAGSVVARGLTDILTPLQQAIQMLQGVQGVPYVFLLTDGAVENERDIARYLQVCPSYHYKLHHFQILSQDFYVAAVENCLSGSKHFCGTCLTSGF